MTLVRWETPGHVDGCKGEWSVRVGRGLRDDTVQRVEVFCWDCGARRMWTPTEDAQHLSETSYGGSPETLVRDGLLAALPPVKVGPVWLHPESAIGYGYGRTEANPAGIYDWLVADREGNVLGHVGYHTTPRGAERYGWGSLSDAAGHGAGCKTPQAAARQLAEAAL